MDSEDQSVVQELSNGGLKSLDLRQSLTNVRLEDKDFNQDLDSLSDSELRELLQRIKESNHLQTRENDVLLGYISQIKDFDFASFRDKGMPHHRRRSVASSASATSDEGGPTRSSVPSHSYSRSMSFGEGPLALSVQHKCFIASKEQNELLKRLRECKKTGLLVIHELDSRFQETDLQKSNLKKSMAYFNEEVRIKGKHPVTKRIMMQKVLKFFNHEFKSKYLLTQELRMQTQSESNQTLKVLKEMKDRKKALENVQDVDVRKIKIESRRTSDLYKAISKRHLMKKVQASRSMQFLDDFRKILDRELDTVKVLMKQIEFQRNIQALIDVERRNLSREKEQLEAAKKKIMNDPRQRSLPPVIDYVRLKADVKDTSRRLKKWKSKVEVAEQSLRLLKEKCRN